MSKSIDASISEGANLIKQQQFHAGIALLEKISQENNSKAQNERAKRFAEKAMKHLSADPYEALNLPKKSSRKDVKKTYRKLALKYHPDKNKYTADLFKVIQSAYDKLKDKPTPKKGQAFTKPAPPASYTREHKQSNKTTKNKSRSSDHHYAKYKKSSVPHPPRPDTHAKYYSAKQTQQQKSEGGASSFFRPANEARPAGTSSKHKFNNKGGYPRPPWRKKPNVSTYEDKPKSARAGYTDKSYDYYSNMPQSARTGYEESKSKSRKERKKPTRARDMPGFPERKPCHNRDSSDSSSSKYPYSRKYNQQYQREKYRKKPTPTPDTFDGISPEDYEKAEEAMKTFWETGEFPFSFAKNAPAKAADLFAKMFQQQTPEARDAFKRAFANKFANTKTTNAWMGVNQPRVYKQRPKSEVPPKPSTQNARTSAGGLPTPRVTGLQMHEAADNSVVLLWNTVCQGISQGLTDVLYELQFKEFGAKHWSVSSDTIRTTTVRKKGLKPGTRYEFRVRARACGKEGAFSQSIAVRTESSVPSPPDIENILEIKEDSVRIIWSCKECNGASVRQYELQWRHVGSINWQTASSTLKGTDCRKKNLLPDRKYEFRVRAMNRVGWGGWSVALSCKTKFQGEKSNVKKAVHSDKNKGGEKSKDAEDKLAEWIRLKKKEQQQKAELEKKRRRLQELDKEEPSNTAKESKSHGATKTHSVKPENHATPKRKNTMVLPTEYYEMIDDDGNTYYWNAVTGSDWNPPKWVDRYDDDRNIYYENTVNGESVWECPSEFINIVRNQDGMPFTDGDIAENFDQENENDNNMESPLDDVLFSPGEKKIMADIYKENSDYNASPFAKQAMKNAMKKSSILRHSFKPPSSTTSVL